MKLPAFRRIITEDYPVQYREVISKLAYSLNSFMDTVNIALNSNLSVNDNTTSVQKKITVIVNASGTPISGGTVATGLSGQCGGTRVIAAVNNTLVTAYPTGTPFISFTNNTTSSNSIAINNITNLKANNSYTLTVIFDPSSG
jgi:hypothetical protein